MLNKYLFIDRDGTLIDEPLDYQVDSFSKLKLKTNVIPGLIALTKAGYKLVIVSNQDGVGTAQFPSDQFEKVMNFLLEVFNTQGIQFEAVLICPHFERDNCECRKPKLGLVQNYLNIIDIDKSYVIGDRLTDVALANNMGIKSILVDKDMDWCAIAETIIQNARSATINRITTETQVSIKLSLNPSGKNEIKTGIGFFDHMLMQLLSHGGMSASIETQGDLHIDEHHTVEDTALSLGEALKKALGDKCGIARFGFVLPMDESLSEVALDIGGRPYFVFEGEFARDKLGDFPTELVAHFFQSFAQALGASLHIKVRGENTHHMIESIFKAVGRTLRQATQIEGNILPSTKGIL